MAVASDSRRSAVARQLSTMALSHASTEQPMALVRACAWSNALAKIGLQLPLFVVHDLGVMLSLSPGPGGYEMGPRGAQLQRLNLGSAAKSAIGEYGQLLATLAESETLTRLAGMRLRDELIGVLLGRVLGDVFHRWRDKPRGAAPLLPLELGEVSNSDFAGLWADYDQRGVLSFVDHVGKQRLNLYTQIELIDLDTVRLLGMFKDGAGTASQALGQAVDLVDLTAALGSPEAHDVAHFSLDLLPSVLETRRSHGAQTFAVDGYASIERRGTVDSLVLSELAYPKEVFDQKVIDNELLFYGRDKQREDERRLHYVMIDASASMRGQRQVFARGLALALIKKLTLKGDEIWLRFFDARLHETMKISRAGQVPVPYVLSFRSERGRNYGRVFRQLTQELTRLRADSGQQVVLYIITHGQCHVEPEVMSQLRALAYSYGIIILPTGPLPEFVSMLHRHQVVDASAIATRRGRQQRALDIVSEIRNEVGAAL